MRLTLVLAVWLSAAAAKAGECGGCAWPFAGGTVTEVVILPTPPRPPDDAELRRAGLVPFPAPRSADTVATPGYAPAESGADDAAGIPVVQGTPAPAAPATATASPVPPTAATAPTADNGPRIVRAEPEADASPPEGLEETPALAAAWKPLDWTGAVTITPQPAPAGGQGSALRVALAAGDSDGGKTPAEKWGIGLTHRSIAAMGGLKLDILNGRDRPVILAAGVFVLAEGKRVYYESTPRRLAPGWNRDVRFDGAEASWKTEASAWRFERAWAGGAPVQELDLLLYDAPAEPGIYLDRLRIEPARK